MIRNIDFKFNFKKIKQKTMKKALKTAGIFLALAFIFLFFQIYIPANQSSHETITYTVEKGWGDDEIAKDLQKLGIIRSSYFFRFYVVVSFRHSELKAGKYSLSPRMSIYQVAKTISNGDVIKNMVVIPEGWDIRDISKYLETKEICQKDEFAKLASQDYSESFSFLKDKPKKMSLEGYLFPDTYQVSDSQTCKDMIHDMLANFEKKITDDIRAEIAKQKKTIFDTIIMASIVEKEVSSLEDKKIVAGIFYKRLEIGMPLQIDATINYITNKNDPGVAIKDTKIDSPYNTYMYRGLPKGPISNPGIDSILAALQPKKTSYLYYLSSRSGKTIFSKNWQEHIAARQLYLTP